MSLTNADRDTAITNAITEGRIPESRRRHYEAQWASDPTATSRLLTAPMEEGGLAPGLVGAGVADTSALDRALRSAVGLRS